MCDIVSDIDAKFEILTKVQMADKGLWTIFSLSTLKPRPPQTTSVYKIKK